MSYIGVTPAEAYASFYVQHFTTSATTSYSLDYVVTNENELRLVINNVVQQPGSGKAYTAADQTLTLSEATTSSDAMYAVFLGRALQTVNPPAGSVGTSQLAADAVTTAKINDDAVTTAKILDDNVTTAKILDNNVTLAKLADGTQGDILYYGASGAPALLGFGTSGDFLKTQGTGANPVWATPGGGAWTKIESQTASTDSYITFSTLSTDYRDFRVIGSGVVPSSDGANAEFQISSAGAFLTSGYTWAASGSDEDSVVRTNGSGADSSLQMNYTGVGNIGGENIYFEMTVEDVHSTSNQKAMSWVSTNPASANKYEQMRGGGRKEVTLAALDGLRFFFSTGTVSTGELTLYGRKVT
jgi:hypothetical protein